MLMKLLIFVAATLMLHQAQSVSAAATEFQVSPGQNDDHIFERITNGEAANRGELPWQVRIVIDGNVLCGGSLISPEWVLTAAHCVKDRKTFKITLGATDLSKVEEGRIVVTSTTAFVHRSFNVEGIMHDIAVIKLPSPVPLSSFISTIRLGARSDYFKTFEGVEATAGGWGKISDNITIRPPDVLFKVSLTVISNDACSKYLTDGASFSKVCCSGMGGKSTCQGDSGGPLTIVEEDGLPTQIGITSFVSLAGCTLGRPSGFVRLYRYLLWINYHTGIEVRL